MAKKAIKVVALTEDILSHGTTDSATIKHMVGCIAKDRVHFERLVSATAASVVMHAVMHGDVTLADRFCEGLVMSLGGQLKGKSKTMIRTNELRAWFVKSGPFTFNQEAGTFGLSKDRRIKLKAEMDKSVKDFGKNLITNSFWVVKPEPEFKGFDFDAELQKIIAKARKYAKDEKKKDKTKLGHIDDVAKFFGTILVGQQMPEPEVEADDDGTPVGEQMIEGNSEFATATVN